mgnify:FL=1
MRLGKHWTRLLIAAAAGFLPCGALTAQGYASTGRGYAELALLRVSFSGDSMANRVRPGYGFDISGVIPVQPPLLVAIGFQYSSHPTNDSTSSHLGALQLYLEPRFALRESGPVIPYLSAHVGLLRWSQDVLLEDDSGMLAFANEVQSGTAFGVGAGVLIRVTPHMRGYFSAGFQKVSLGSISASGAPEPLSTAARGTSLMVRMGASLEFSATASQLRTHPGR